MKLTQGNLQKTNNYIRQQGRNPANVTINEKRNIYNAHLKPIPIKFVHNLLNKVSKNVAVKKLVDMGFDENRVRNVLVTASSPQKTREQVKNITGYNIYTNRNRLIKLAHAAIDISRGRNINIPQTFHSIRPALRKIAILIGFSDENDIRRFLIIVKYILQNTYDRKLTPEQRFKMGQRIGQLVVALSKKFMVLPISDAYKNLLKGFNASKAPRKIFIGYIGQRLKKAT